jgi:hypothetical protein
MFIYSTSNYSNLDDLTLYLDEYRSNENSVLDNANFALKIMPGYNSERNALYMEQTTDLQRSTITNALSLMETFNMNSTYFIINKTKMFFPKLVFSKDNIPVGNSVSMCISLSWATKDRNIFFDS